MPEITPAPRAGTWLRITLAPIVWTPQPRAGTYVKLFPLPPPASGGIFFDAMMIGGGVSQ